MKPVGYIPNMNVHTPKDSRNTEPGRIAMSIEDTAPLTKLEDRLKERMN